MKRLIYAAGLFAAIACPPCPHLNAQTHDARATIPFSFQVGKSIMPAGEYLIQQSGDLLTVREESGKKAAMHLTLPASRSTVSPYPQLEFKRYGEGYFLTTIWDGRSHEGRALMQSKREQELASRYKPAQTASVTLHEK